MAQERANNRFQVPEVIDPPDTLCLTMTVPNEDTHIANLNGAILALCMARAYHDRPGVRSVDIANVWRRYVQTMKFTDCAGNEVFPISGEIDDIMADVCSLLRYHKGRLQGWCECGGTFSWQDIGSDDNSAPTGSAGQPSGDQPQPGAGGSQCYDLAWDAHGKALLPTTVNPGDQLTVTTASGAGNGPYEAYWRCVDGKVYFAGACVGITATNGANLNPSLPNGMLVMLINGVYTTAVPGTVYTVPGTVPPNSNVEFMANFPAGSASGSYKMNVCRQNNAAASGCHHLDFRVSDYGFVDWSSAGGAPTWVPGTGWQHPGGGGNNLQIKFIAASAFTVTRVQYQMNDDAGSPASSSGCEASFPLGTTYPGTAVLPCLSGTNTADGSGSVSGTTFGLDIEDGHATTLTIIEVNIFWQGIDPNPAWPTC